MENFTRGLSIGRRLSFLAIGFFDNEKNYTFAKNINMENNQQENQLNIELPEDIAEGIYSNFAIIGHSNQEFVVDFIRLMPGVPKAKVKSRIVLSPQHAKRLVAAMNDNIKKYEQQFGKIQDSSEVAAFPMNFGPTAQA